MHVPEHKWKIWVCPHGERVEWRGDEQHWVHADTDGLLCGETMMTLIEPRNDRGVVDQSEHSDDEFRQVWDAWQEGLTEIKQLRTIIRDAGLGAVDHE